MDWVQFMSARQLMAEERIGTSQRVADANEQAEVEATKAALRKAGPPVVLKPREVVTPPEPLILSKGETKRGRVA